MLRVVSAASGEEVHAYDKAQFDAMVADSGATVGALKRHLAVKHFERKYSRFQLRILREGNPEELEDDEIIVLPMDLQLMLLSHHLPPDAERDERFLESCSDGLVHEVEQALKGLQDPNVKDDDDRNGLTLAAYGGHLNVAFLLLEAGAEESYFEGNAIHTFYAMDCRVLLHQAADVGRLGLVRLLLEVHADLEPEDVWCLRPLHLASQRGHLEVVRLLLRSRAEMNSRDTNHRHPLHLAAFAGQVDVVKLLLDSAAALEACAAGGERPLHMAVRNVAVVRLLLDSAARVDAKDVKGRRPLHWAARLGHPDAVRALLELGDKEARDQEGKTAYEVALGRRRKALRRLRGLEPDWELPSTIDQLYPGPFVFLEVLELSETSPG